jgi:hypothetical protein
MLSQDEKPSLRQQCCHKMRSLRCASNVVARREAFAAPAMFSQDEKPSLRQQ